MLLLTIGAGSLAILPFGVRPTRWAVWANCTQFCREFVRQPSPSGSHAIIRLSSALIILLMMSYENSIKVEITAPSRSKPCENLHAFFDNGYKINYPHGTDRLGTKKETDEKRLFNFIKKDLELLKISPEFPAKFTFLKFEEHSGMKKYYEALSAQKVGIWDNTPNTGYMMFAEIVMPAKSCFIAGTFKRTAYFSIYSLHEDALGRIRKRLEEAGITLF